MTRLIVAVLASLVSGAAPPGATVPPGVFRTWGIHPAEPLHMRSGGLTIDVASIPCPGPVKTEGCAFDGVNNQALITVAAPGRAPLRLVSDREASFVRVAAVKLAGSATHLGVVVDNQWGGSGGITAVTVIEPTAHGFRAVPLRSRSTETVEGRIEDHPRDVTGDGIVDFVLEDARFDGVYGCNACTPRPPLILSAIHGRSVDLSASPSARAVFAADMARLRPRCFATGDTDRNGACAAYVADGARAGRFPSAWRDMLIHYQRDAQFRPWRACARPGEPAGERAADASPCYATFPASLRAFLVATGYITRAQAAAAPLD